MIELRKVKEKHQEKLFELANVTGVGLACKYVGGEKTDVHCVRVYVKEKKPLRELAEEDIVPTELDGIPTDIIECDWKPAWHVIRERPALGGASIGNTGVPHIRTGTLGLKCYDGDAGHGLILSNCHVLAQADDENRSVAGVGDPIIQPGDADGGSSPDDKVGELARWHKFRVPGQPFITGTNFNLVDAAVAEIDEDGMVSAEIHDGIGYPQGVRGIGPDDVTESTAVQKSGRTTDLTTGTIDDWDATGNVDFGYGSIKLIHQVVVLGDGGQPFIQPGDSGAAVFDMRGRFVGLAWGYSGNYGIMSHATATLSRLQVYLLEKTGESYIGGIDQLRYAGNEAVVTAHQYSGVNYPAHDYPNAASNGSLVAAVWSRSGHVYCVTTSDDGGTWSSTTRADSLIELDSDNPFATVAVDSNNNIFVAYRGDGGNIRCAKSSDGGSSFSSVVLVDDQGYTPVNPHIVVDSSDNLYVMYYVTDVPPYSVSFWGEAYVAKSTDNGASFGASVQVGSSDTYLPQDDPQVGCFYCDDTDVLHIALQGEGEYYTQHIYYSKSTNGGASFSTPDRVIVFHYTGGRSDIGPVVAAISGNPIVAFRHYGCGTAWGYEWDGSSWLPGSRIDDNGGAFNPTVCQQGTWWFRCCYKTEAEKEIHLATDSPMVGWTGTRIDEATIPPDYVYSPQAFRYGDYVREVWGRLLGGASPAHTYFFLA